MCFPIILKFLLLPETHNPLQLPVLFFSSFFLRFRKAQNALQLSVFFSFLSLQTLSEILGNWKQKNILRTIEQLILFTYLFL